MGNEWPLVKLESIAEVIDSRHQTPIYSGVGYPMVRVVDVKGGVLQLEDTKKVSQEVYDDFSKGRDPVAGDLVISRVGSYGNVSYVSTEEKFCLGQNTALIIPKEKNRFLYYTLISPQVKYQIEQMVVGAVQKTLSLKCIKNLDIPQPSEEIKKAIADFLSEIDDKITLNRQINQTLEQMAQTLFKSWFVDFDPAIDNALDAGNEIPEPLQARAELRQKMRGSQDFKPLPAEVRVLFPAEFEESELGWVPKGWDVQTFSEISYILNGCAFKSEDYVKEGNFVLRTKNFTQNQVERYTDDVFLPDSFLDSHSQHLCQPYDYHLVMVGASVGNCAIIYPHQLPAFRNQNMWCFRTKKPDLISQSFIKYLLDFVVTKSLGLASGSAREFFRKGDFGDQLVCLGTSDIQILFKNICEPYLTKMGMLCAENKSLIQLRDTLLPKLISGELRLDDLPDEVVTAANE